MAYIVPIMIISIALALDFLHYLNYNGSKIVNKILSFRPNYGANNYCGISNVRAHFLFVVLPICLSFCFNVFTLIAAILRIKTSTLGPSRPSISKNEDHHSNRHDYSSRSRSRSRDRDRDRSRPMMASNSFQHRIVWYLKIFILLGVLNLFTFIGNAFLNNCQVANFWSLMLLSSHGKCFVGKKLHLFCLMFVCLFCLMPRHLHIHCIRMQKTHFSSTVSTI